MLNRKMTCPLQTDNADLLLDYCARALDQERKAQLEAHMEGCADCREMASAQAQVWSAMDLYDAEPISADFDRQLFDRIDRTEHSTAWQRLTRQVRDFFQLQPAWKPVLSVAAASAVVALFILVREESRQPAPQPTATFDVRDVEEAERALEDIEMLRQFDAAPADPGGSGQKEVI